MAKKTTTRTSKKPGTTRNSTTAIQVKRGSELIGTLQRYAEYNLHSRYNFSFSKTTQKKLVAYGPWLAIALVTAVVPQLMALAKTGSLITVSGFFNTIFFNQESWVILLILFANILLLVDGMSKLFEKSIIGWNRVYQATLITTGYIVWQLVDNISQPAAPILALVGAVLVLFTLFDIKKYYK